MTRKLALESNTRHAKRENLMANELPSLAFWPLVSIGEHIAPMDITSGQVPIKEAYCPVCTSLPSQVSLSYASV